jgi:hypothetical protein
MKKTILTMILALVALTGQAQKFVDQLTDTYWRNEATGDWLIGITPQHVIYKNKVWDIVSQTEKKDTYTLTLADGPAIMVGKMKKGKRSIIPDKVKNGRFKDFLQFKNI